MKYLKNILSVVLWLACSLCFAQLNDDYVKYIEQYGDLATDQMKRYRIPACITLSQALLESGAGKSYLARNANNHFGIKADKRWSGETLPMDDDKKNELFRKYKSVDQSYEDHSKFLISNRRYEKLFNLDIDDYVGWANGLKECGYATNPKYGALLISLIERYDLQQYDKKRRKKVLQKHITYEVNGVKCIRLQSGDTWSSIYAETGIPIEKLLAYNETDIEYPIYPGNNVFLEKKAKRAHRSMGVKRHRVKVGESMYDISQQYGIRLKNLYKMNKKDASYAVQVGDILLLR